MVRRMVRVFGWLTLMLALAACGPGLQSNLCGAAGEPCCDGACDSGNRCGADGVCTACGAVGQTCCEGAQACVGQAVCGGDGVCASCGGAGQACCTSGDACGAQLACSGGACLPCGAKGQVCCAGGSCQASLGCDEGVCADAVTCVDACSRGESRCANGGIESCVNVGTCTGWQVMVSLCPAGSQCAVTRPGVVQCVERCPGACTLGAVVCAVDGLKRCVAQGECPVLVPEPDDIDRPSCVAGAVVDSEVVWESPTPLGAHFVAIAGDISTSYWVLDDLGNVIHNAQSVWEYEVRPTSARKVVSLTSCGLGSWLVAGASGGMVLRRTGGSWLEEHAADDSVTLRAVACDSGGAWAAGSDGALYYKRNGAPWASVAAAPGVVFNGITSSYAISRVFLVGNGGAIVNCDASGTLPPACAADVSGVSRDLYGVWAGAMAGYAVGQAGTFLERTVGGWGPAPLSGVAPTGDLTAIHGYTTLGTDSHLVAVGDSGAYIAGTIGPFFTSLAVPGERLTGVAVMDDTNVFLATQSGQLWHSPSVVVPASPQLSPRGGFKPVRTSLYGVTVMGTGRLLAVGAGGQRLSRQNGVWAADDLGDTTTVTLRGVASDGNDESYAVGDEGVILVRRYGQWSREAEGLTSTRLRAVAMDAEAVWAVGDDGVWLEKPRSGGGWQPVDTGVTASLAALAVRRNAAGQALEVVAVGDACTVLSRVGSSVSRVDVPGCVGDFLSAAFTSTGDLFIGTSEGQVHLRGGLGFTQQAPGAGQAVRALVPQGDSVWALCDGGGVYRRGTSGWTAYAKQVTSASLTAGVQAPGYGLFIVGEGGLIWNRP